MFDAAAPGALTNLGVGTTEEPEFTYIGTVAILAFDSAIADRVQHSASNVRNRVVDSGTRSRQLFALEQIGRVR